MHAFSHSRPSARHAISSLSALIFPVTLSPSFREQQHSPNQPSAQMTSRSIFQSPLTAYMSIPQSSSQRASLIELGPAWSEAQAHGFPVCRALAASSAFTLGMTSTLSSTCSDSFRAPGMVGSQDPRKLFLKAGQCGQLTEASPARQEGRIFILPGLKVT